MTRARCFQVDAFAIAPFTGNPAAVCYLDEPQSDRWYQAVANEMNLSETAFVSPEDGEYRLRWFTPEVEVDLCGHATLATAHVLWRELHRADDKPLRFRTRSGVLTARCQGAVIDLDFPSTPARPTDPPAELLDGLGIEPQWVGNNGFDWLVIVPRESQVRALDPDQKRLMKVPARGIIVSAPTDEGPYDFVSRFFGPCVGIPEDPVTGSAHCTLAPYWGERLAKQALVGFQASRRGGEVHVRNEGERVHLGGQAITVMRGEWVVFPNA
ncbi:MAG TPA: oxidoreductase [Planctomycetaceae bacterium]|nr:oxidoreductase [Planctomycetaceae bacterium]HRF01079.1 PhzF family phenazine biosynthesis protein [Pirellulaceae bacterium]